MIHLVYSKKKTYKQLSQAVLIAFEDRQKAFWQRNIKEKCITKTQELEGFN